MSSTEKRSLIQSGATTLLAAIKEVSEIRKIIPGILVEIQELKKLVPLVTTKCQRFPVKFLAFKEASKISENVGASVISGLVKSPFKLFSSMDLSIMAEVGVIVLESTELQFSRKWSNL